MLEGSGLNMLMILGLIMIAAGIVFALITAVSRGEAYEYLWGVFFAEWGGMLLLNGIFIATDLARIGISLFFALAMGSTAFMWWKLHREAVKSSNTGTYSNDRPQ